MNHIHIFREDYPEEKQREGIAVGTAMITGKCDKCQYLKECESNSNFKFPSDAECMKIKARLESSVC